MEDIKEKTADEIFEELGYKSIPKNPSQIYDIKYYKDDDNVYYFHFDRKILVFKKRKNSNWGDYIGYSGEEEKIKEYIQDLIKANLVVKE